MTNDIISICEYISGTDCDNNYCLFCQPTHCDCNVYISASQWIDDIDEKIAWLKKVREKVLADYPM